MSAREDTAGVRMWLDIGHHKSYDGTKMSIKRHRGIKMIVASEHQAKAKAERNTGNRQKASKRARGGKEEQ